MILLSQFFISSTLCSSDAQKPKPKNKIYAGMRRFFYGAQPKRNTLKLIIFFFANFLVGYNMENDVLIRHFKY